MSKSRKSYNSWVIVPLIVLLAGAGLFAYFNAEVLPEKVETVDSTATEVDTLVIDSLSQDSLD
jgi:hypothetical protein